jgi:3-hydroxy-9,10-secoandrosta-1,3,5(10)-triene-9,17-dione monooxygenase reductase component
VSNELRRAFGHFATGVTIVTTADGRGGRVGMTANSFSSLSLDPPLVLWSLAKSSTNYATFAAATHFAVHVLDAAQAATARQFATKDVDRFGAMATSGGQGGCPLLDRYHACFQCETWARYEGGDHTILVGRVLAVDERPGDPLLFYRGRFARVVADDDPPRAGP